MQRRVAIFSDVHSNYLALQAVLQDIELKKVDAVVCAGDLVGYGPAPNEVIGLIREKGIKTVSGNYDDAIANFRPVCGCDYISARAQEVGEYSIRFTKEVLKEENLQFLLSLPPHVYLKIAGNCLEFVEPAMSEGIYPLEHPMQAWLAPDSSEIRNYREQARSFVPCHKPESGEWLINVFHGSPRRLNEYLRSTSVLEEFEEASKLSPGNVCVYGHTHEAYHKLINGVHFINAGSAGKPKHGNPNVNYVILELGERVVAEFREVAYDFEKTAAEMEGLGHPPELIHMIRTGVE